MFGKKKKIHTIKYVMLQDGLSNFLNDVCINIIIDENEKLVKFIEPKKKNSGSTANLSIDKIIRVQTGTRNKIINNGGTGATLVGGMIAGTTGAIIGANSGNKAQSLLTLTITYISNEEEKQIHLYETNYYGTSTIQLLKTILDKNIENNIIKSKHIDL